MGTTTSAREVLGMEMPPGKSLTLFPRHLRHLLRHVQSPVGKHRDAGVTNRHPSCCLEEIGGPAQHGMNSPILLQTQRKLENSISNYREGLVSGVTFSPLPILWVTSSKILRHLWGSPQLGPHRSLDRLDVDRGIKLTYGTSMDSSTRQSRHRELSFPALIQRHPYFCILDLFIFTTC